jgi:MFS family permease
VLSGALRSRNFLLLLACDVTSLTGNAVAVVAVPFAVLAVGGSAADVGYVSTAMLVPVIIFLLIGGVVADRLPRHLVMVAGDVVQAAAQAISAVVVLSGHGAVWQLLVLAAVRGTGFGFYFPAEAGLLPQTVAPDDRAQANAIDRVGRNGAQIAGSALGGVAVATLGPGWGLALDAISFAVAALLRAGMRFSALPPAESSGMLRELREGWREFVSRRWLWTIVVQFACVNAVVLATINVLGPLVAKAHYGGAKSWGLVLAAYSVGSVIGGIAMIRLRPVRMLLVATVAVLGAPLLLFALVPPLIVLLIVAAALLTGACLQVFGVNWATTMQQEIPLTALSRVSAYDALGSLVLAPIGTAIAGPLADNFGTSPVLVAGAVLIVVLTVAVLIVPEVRSLRRENVADSGEHRRTYDKRSIASTRLARRTRKSGASKPG